jgi:hypothetical protein
MARLVGVALRQIFYFFRFPQGRACAKIAQRLLDVMATAGERRLLPFRDGEATNDAKSPGT